MAAEKVEEDCRVAEVLNALAEKLLKGLLVADGVPPPRTHDLEALADLLCPTQSLHEDVQEALWHPSGLSAIPRYPVSTARGSPGRAQRAIDALDRTIGRVQCTYDWKVPRRPERS